MQNLIKKRLFCLKKEGEAKSQNSGVLPKPIAGFEKQ